MATIWKIDGFEHGSYTQGTGGVYGTATGSGSIVTSPARSGLRALRFNTAASAGRIEYNLPASTRTYAEVFYLRFAAFPASASQLMRLIGASISLQYDTASGKLRLSGDTDVTFGPVLSLDTWYRVDIKGNSTADPWTATAQVDGDAGTEGTVSAAAAAADIVSLILGPIGTTTYDVLYDDWVISLLDTDYPLGEHAIESLIPSSDGTHNIDTAGDFDSFVGTAFDNSTTNGYTFIAHRPLQRANTADQVIRQELPLADPTRYMEFGLENRTLTGSPVAARAYASHIESAATGASLGEVQLLLADNTEVLTEGSISAINSTEDPATAVALRKRMCIDPSGGWDNTKIDGLKVRVGFADGDPDVNFIDFMVEVAYAPLTEGPTVKWYAVSTPLRS